MRQIREIKNRRTNRSYGVAFEDYGRCEPGTAGISSATLQQGHRTLSDLELNSATPTMSRFSPPVY